MKAKKRIAVIILILFILLTVAVLCFFQFNALGYRMSVPYRHSFAEFGDSIYFNRGYSGDKEQAAALAKEARDRNIGFWGELRSEPVIIICDDSALLAKLGGDHDTMSTGFPVKQSYISISNEYCNTDILAHEMSHAELFERLNAKAVKALPVWFNEGVALQNDYRERYSEESWKERTDNGKNAIAPKDMDESAEFYAGTVEDRQLRYINAKHYVSEWLEKHQHQALFELIDSLNSGTAFDEAYGS